MKRRIFFLILTIAWMVVIFSFSAKPAEQSDDLSLSVGHRIGQLLVPEFEEWTVEEQEAFAQRINLPIRKCAHGTEYGVLGICLAGAFAGGLRIRRKEAREAYPKWRWFLACVVVGVAYAASDEIHQLFVPGRAGRVTDVLIDGGGLVIGVLVAMVAVTIYTTKKQACVQEI